MTSFRNYRAVVLAGMLGVMAACASLDVENPNAPDRTRALGQAADITSLLSGGYYNWYFAQQDFPPSIPLGAVASHNSMSWGNWGARFYSSVPRRGFQNDPTDINSNVLVEVPWYNNYAALVSANLAITQAQNPEIFPTTDAELQATSKMLVAGSRFIQGATLANIALYFNQGFVVDENTPAGTTPPFVGPDSIKKAALAKLDAAIAAATAPGANFTLPQSFLNISGWTNAQLAQVARTEAARLITYFPRTAAQLAAVPAADWARAETYARGGITFNPSITGNNNNWYDGYKYLGEDWDTWVRVNQRVVAELDPSQPTTYAYTCPVAATGCTNPAPAPVSADKRYDPTPRDDASAGSLPTADFIYVRYDNFNPARGRYHFSQIGHNRYGYHGVLAADGGGLGVVPFRLKAENDLLLAEALVRQNKNLTEAATLINNSRVTRGQLPALTGTAADLTQTAGLAPTTYGTYNATGLQLILIRAIMYERDIELMNSSAITPYYDARRTDRFTTFSVNAANDLKDSPRQFPVPAKELSALQKELYTIKGTDSIPGVVSALRVRGGVFEPRASISARNMGSLYRIGDQFVGVGVVGDVAEQLRLRNLDLARSKKPF